jgi:hypothetical protein
MNAHMPPHASRCRLWYVSGLRRWTLSCSLESTTVLLWRVTTRAPCLPRMRRSACPSTGWLGQQPHRPSSSEVRAQLCLSLCMCVPSCTDRTQQQARPEAIPVHGRLTPVCGVPARSRGPTDRGELLAGLQLEHIRIRADRERQDTHHDWRPACRGRQQPATQRTQQTPRQLGAGFMQLNRGQ